MLHAVLHGTEALVYSNHPREAAASTCLAKIFCRIASGVHWFLLSTAVPMQLQALVLAVVALKQTRIVFDIMCLTWDE